jgi:hypothetical protein
MIYTGIGSRKTPQEVCDVMYAMAAVFGEEGWTLRSGGAPGADLAFERGCDSVSGPKEIYLPWDGFNSDQRQDCSPNGVVVLNNKEAYSIASKYHPKWGSLNAGSRALMARNSHQILGMDLETPTDLVICWTKDGKGLGGTGQALRIARDLDIPVVDLGAFDYIYEATKKVGQVVELLTIIRPFDKSTSL